MSLGRLDSQINKTVQIHKFQRRLLTKWNYDTIMPFFILNLKVCILCYFNWGFTYTSVDSFIREPEQRIYPKYWDTLNPYHTCP